MEQLVEDKLNQYAPHIIKRSCVLNGTATMQDLSLMDAINDILQGKGILEAGQTFDKL
ncbi:MAG: hypothetical protein R3E79_45045 [Caldilineaceae bacterium]